MKGIFAKQTYYAALVRLFISIVSLLSLTPLSAQAQNNKLTIPTAFLPAQVHALSTIPPNGDLNPYGVAFVPKHFPPGLAKPRDILVSNFNNNQNLQGTGSTIVDIAKNGTFSVFFQGKGLMGLTTALNVLKKGFVLVGNFPSPDGTCGNAQQGSILVINNQGQQIQTIVDPVFINGPWDSTVYDQGDEAKLFIANALTGNVVRFDLAISATGVTVKKKILISSGYKHQCDPVTFVDAPTGLVYDPDIDILYVASTADNGVFAVPHAASTLHDQGRGTMIFAHKDHFHGPLAMMGAPNGDLVASNNDAINPDPKHPSALTEFTPFGIFVKEITMDANPGAAFGLNVETSKDFYRFAAVNDNQNLLLVWTLPRLPTSTDAGKKIH